MGRFSEDDARLVAEAPAMYEVCRLLDSMGDEDFDYMTAEEAADKAAQIMARLRGDNAND